MRPLDDRIVRGSLLSLRAAGPVLREWCERARWSPEANRGRVSAVFLWGRGDRQWQVDGMSSARKQITALDSRGID